MYEVLINFFYWLLIKSEESANSSSSLEVEAASKKPFYLVLEVLLSRFKKKYNLTPKKKAQIGLLSKDFLRS